MFERYTEKARRVVFFARYEASQFGSPYIDTQHLLLGLFRENKHITSKLLKSPASVDGIRRKIESRASQNEKIPTSVDIPLSNESKRVLAYAAEEAEQLSHQHIGSEHLLLGLLREERCLAAQLLNEEGLTLESVRKEAAAWPPEAGTSVLADLVSKLRPRPTVEIHGRKLDLESVKAKADELIKFSWARQAWKALDIVVDRENRRISFDLNAANGKRYQLQPGGWTKEPCAICGWELQAESGPDRSEGFTNGRRWICAECYHRFVEGKDTGRSSWDAT